MAVSTPLNFSQDSFFLRALIHGLRCLTSKGHQFHIDFKLLDVNLFARRRFLTRIIICFFAAVLTGLRILPRTRLAGVWIRLPSLSRMFLLVVMVVGI